MQVSKELHVRVRVRLDYQLYVCYTSRTRKVFSCIFKLPVVFWQFKLDLKDTGRLSYHLQSDLVSP